MLFFYYDFLAEQIRSIIQKMLYICRLVFLRKIKTIIY